MERAGRHKQNMVGANHPVAGVHRGAFDDRQNIALHTFAAHVRSVSGLAACYFVDLVDKDNSHLLGALDSHARHLIHVEQLAFFFLDQIFERISHVHFALLFLLAEHATQHLLEVDVHLLDALVGDDFERRHHPFADFEVHHALVELAFTQLRAKFFPRALVLLALRGCIAFERSRRSRWRRRQQHIQHSFFSSLLGALGDFIQFFFAHHVDGHFDKIAHHRFHIAPDVADFRVLRRFHFHKRTTRQPCQPPCDFRLADSRRPDHQNIFR